MRFLDLPPVYLFAALCLAYAVGEVAPLNLGPLGRGVGAGVFWAGLAVLALAVVEFARARTTIIPRQEPSGLITTGIYRLTRNPIYLADALILAGLALRWDAGLALPLVPLFVWFITRRFIAQEERTLRAAFPDTFPAYLSRTRRWL